MSESEKAYLAACQVMGEAYLAWEQAADAEKLASAAFKRAAQAQEEAWHEFQKLRGEEAPWEALSKVRFGDEA